MINNIFEQDYNINEQTCFLCTNTSRQITPEHVFPKWLQNRYDLWNERITLLNQSIIPYKNLTIPCCIDCNTKFLSNLEAKISEAVLLGYEKAISIDKRLWYLWLAKIFYGVLRKEVQLDLTRSNPDAGKILSESNLKSFSNLHFFLQGIRKKHEFSGGLPYSVLICNLHDLGEKKSYFYQDNYGFMAMAIRMGEIGVLVSFEDNQLSEKSYGKYLKDVNGRKLHPIQFQELFSRVIYQLSLIDNKNINYLTSFDINETNTSKTDVLGNLNLGKWNQKDYSKCMQFHLENWVPDDTSWFIEPNLVPTWMTNDDGSLKILSEQEILSFK